MSGADPNGSGVVPGPDESREANPTSAEDADEAGEQVERLGRHSEPQSENDPAPSETPSAPGPENDTDQ